MRKTSAAEVRKRPRRDGRVCARSMVKRKKGRSRGWGRQSSEGLPSCEGSAGGSATDVPARGKTGYVWNLGALRCELPRLCAIASATKLIGRRSSVLERRPDDIWHHGATPHSQIVPSFELEANIVPSFEKVTPTTGPVCPSSTRSRLPHSSGRLSSA
jgi:hypothetical protein